MFGHNPQLLRLIAVGLAEITQLPSSAVTIAVLVMQRTKISTELNIYKAPLSSVSSMEE